MTEAVRTAPRSLDRAGGIAALCLAASYIFGFGLFIGFIDRTGYDGPIGDVAFVSDHLSLLSLAMIVLYPLAACALTVLVIAMNRRASQAIEGPMQIATAFGLIWAAILFASGMISLIGMNVVAETSADFPELAASSWIAIAVVQDALGGGNEFLGGLWMGMVSWLFLRQALISKPLAWIGIALGLVGMASLVPALGEIVDLFGIGQIIWFAWLGASLIRTQRS